jgi:hypothetical protein
MKYEVKKAFWHRNRPVSVGEVLDLDPDGARWLVGQGKVAPVGADDKGQAQGRPEQKRKGRGRAAAEENNVPVAPAATEGDEK